jgi:hypothetical protein
MLIDYAVGIDLEVVLHVQLAVKYVVPSVTFLMGFPIYDVAIGRYTRPSSPGDNRRKWIRVIQIGYPPFSLHCNWQFSKLTVTKFWLGLHVTHVTFWRENSRVRNRGFLCFLFVRPLRFLVGYITLVWSLRTIDGCNRSCISFRALIEIDTPIAIFRIGIDM